jgi:hypothetical protein
MSSSPLSDLTNAIVLSWDENGRKVRISTSDNDLFFTTVGEAIEACKARDFQEDFKRQFDGLLGVLAEWIKKHKDHIDRAYLTIRDAGLLFLPITKFSRLDPDFEDLLTDLDIQIAQDDKYSHITMSVLALPNTSSEAISSFVNPKHSPLVYHNAE